VRIEALTRTSGWSKDAGAVSRQCADKASIHQGGARPHTRGLSRSGGIIAQPARESAVCADFMSIAQGKCRHMS